MQCSINKLLSLVGYYLWRGPPLPWVITKDTMTVVMQDVDCNTTGSFQDNCLIIHWHQPHTVFHYYYKLMMENIVGFSRWGVGHCFSYYLNLICYDCDCYGLTVADNAATERSQSSPQLVVSIKKVSMIFSSTPRYYYVMSGSEWELAQPASPGLMCSPFPNNWSIII